MPDPSAIHQLGIDFDAAWNRRDAAAVGGLFLDDADLQVPRGDLLRGREQIERYYAGAFANMPPDRRHNIMYQHVRFVTSDVAIGDGVALILRAGAAAEERYFHVLFTAWPRTDMADGASPRCAPWSLERDDDPRVQPRAFGRS
jgi:uncharacterized protein (TIGR02246 family)